MTGVLDQLAMGLDIAALHPLLQCPLAPGRGAIQPVQDPGAHGDPDGQQDKDPFDQHDGIPWFENATSMAAALKNGLAGDANRESVHAIRLRGPGGDAQGPSRRGRRGDQK